jgi:hypothetical protein
MDFVILKYFHGIGSRTIRKKLRDLSPRANYTEGQQLVGEISANFC